MLVPPPESYNGRLSTFIEQYIVPNFPARDSLIAWTEALLTYHLDQPHPLCIVRGRLLGALRQMHGLTVIDSDNSPGIWAYLRCHDGGINANELTSVIDQGAVPVLMAIAREGRSEWKYGQTLTPGDKALVWGCRLKHCHIFPARPRTEQLSLRQLALRNIAPLNHFLFPAPRAFNMALAVAGGQQPRDLGESDLVISWVLHALASHVSHQGLFDRFVHAIGGAAPVTPLADATIRIHRRPSTRELAASSAEHSNLRKAIGSVPAGARMSHWTLNALHGYYVRTGLPLATVNVSLSLKHPNGGINHVGTFSIDLPALVRAGILASREKDGQLVADIRIVRAADGSYWLAGRDAIRIRLNP